MNDNLHVNLIQQLEKLGLDTQTLPSPNEWQLFLKMVSHLYKHPEKLEQGVIDISARADSAQLAKQTFLANISHEIRTPITSIIGYGLILNEQAIVREDQSSVYMIDKIRASALHLLAIVNDLLDLSRLEAGEVQLNRETFDIHELIEQVVDAVQPEATKRGTTITINYVIKYDKMYSDREKIGKILLNLLSNAAKFTENGRIQVTASTDKDSSGIMWVQFQVADTGIGISPETMDTLFAPFIQGDNSTTREHEGTGLGLTICQRYCQLLGGDIEAKSKIDVGSTFIVRLPLFKRTGALT
jgi:signal transduction histidine kinase